MLILAWVISICIALYMGYLYKNILEAIKTLQTTSKNKISRKPQEVESSTILDPDDPIQMARMEHEHRMRQLNPESYETNDEVR